jgi:hypothetical protein
LAFRGEMKAPGMMGSGFRSVLSATNQGNGASSRRVGAILWGARQAGLCSEYRASILQEDQQRHYHSLVGSSCWISIRSQVVVEIVVLLLERLRNQFWNAASSSAAHLLHAQAEWQAAFRMKGIFLGSIRPPRD